MKEIERTVFVMPLELMAFGSQDVYDSVKDDKDFKRIIGKWVKSGYSKEYVPVVVNRSISNKLSELNIKVYKFSKFAENHLDYKWNSLVAVGVKGVEAMFVTQIGINSVYQEIGLFKEYKEGLIRNVD